MFDKKLIVLFLYFCLFVDIIIFMFGWKIFCKNSMMFIFENKSVVIKNVFKRVFNKENL